MRSKALLGTLLTSVVTIFCINYGTAMAEMKMYDADNQFLGIFYGAEHGPLLYLSSLDAILILQTDETVTPKGRYSDAIVPELYYISSDCSGDSYVYGGDSNARLIFKVGVNYRVVDISSRATFTPASYLDDSGTCHNISSGENAFFFSLDPVTLPFSTPVKNPFHFENTASKSKVVVIPLGH